MKITKRQLRRIIRESNGSSSFSLESNDPEAVRAMDALKDLPVGNQSLAISGGGGYVNVESGGGQQYGDRREAERDADAIVDRLRQAGFKGVGVDIVPFYEIIVYGEAS